MVADATRKPNSVGGLSNQPSEVPRGLIGGDQRTPGEEFDVQFVFAKFFFPVTFLGGKKKVTLETGFFC